jgi:acetoin utilization protein AcuB
MHYLLTTMKVKEVMDKNPAKVSPDMPFEDALNLGQQKGNTGFPVVEKGELVGIITNGDIIRLLSSFLGLGEDGVRITIEGLGARLGELNQIIAILDRHRAPILSIMTKSGQGTQDLIAVVRLKVKDATAIVEDLNSTGFNVTYVSKPLPNKAA